MVTSFIQEHVSDVWVLTGAIRGALKCAGACELTSFRSVDAEIQHIWDGGVTEVGTGITIITAVNNPSVDVIMTRTARVERRVNARPRSLAFAIGRLVTHKKADDQGIYAFSLNGVFSPRIEERWRLRPVTCLGAISSSPPPFSCPLLGASTARVIAGVLGVAECAAFAPLPTPRMMTSSAFLGRARARGERTE